jgi:hypothetical protein
MNYVGLLPVVVGLALSVSVNSPYNQDGLVWEELDPIVDAVGREALLFFYPEVSIVNQPEGKRHGKLTGRVRKNTSGSNYTPKVCAQLNRQKKTQGKPFQRSHAQPRHRNGQNANSINR